MKQLLKIPFTVLAALVSVSAQAQHFIGVTGGLSIPSGNFTKTDYADSKSGFASGGGNIGVTGTYFLTKHFGINGLVSYQGYGFKGAQDLADGYKEDFEIDSATVLIKGRNYGINVLVGPYYALPVARNFFIDARVLVGITSAHLAGNEVYIEDQSDGTFAQQAASAAAFGLQAGLAARYNLSRHFGIMLHGDYFSSKPNFTVSNTNRANEAGRVLTGYNQPISGINLNLSLVYLF